jgi:hypothetical protein
MSSILLFPHLGGFVLVSFYFIIDLFKLIRIRCTVVSCVEYALFSQENVDHSGCVLYTRNKLSCLYGSCSNSIVFHHVADESTKMDSVLTPTKQIHWISKSGENGIKNNHFLGTLFSLFEKCGFKKLPVKENVDHSGCVLYTRNKLLYVELHY